MWRSQLPYILASVVLMTLQPVLVNMSKNSSGKLDYNPVSSTLLSELGKLFISIGMLQWERSPMRPDPREALRFAIPAVIYFVNNNVVFYTLQYIDATTWQLLSQLKTVFTGLLFRLVLGRRLTIIQYLAIWQVACGTTVVHIPKCLSAGAAVGESVEPPHMWYGSCLTVMSCLLSAMGGLYTEKLLKEKVKDSIHLQNMQLYAWGVLFNLVGTVQTDEAVFDRGLLAGYNFWAFAVVLNNALNGLAISAILKYADNIARVYAHAAAMMVTMVFSVCMFGETLTPQLLISVCIVSASALQYSLKPEQLVDPSRYSEVEVAETGSESSAHKEKQGASRENGRGKSELECKV